MSTHRKIFICTLLLLITSLWSYGQKQYTYEDIDSIKACFKKFCDSDTLHRSAMKKLKSMKLATTDEDLYVMEFTMMLIGPNDDTYIGKIKTDVLDVHYVKLVASGYHTIEVSEVIAKDKHGTTIRLKPRRYHITD